MMDLSAARIGILLLQRPAALESPNGSYVEGIWVETADAMPIEAEIQAATQKDLVEYALQDKLDGYVRIYTETPLRTIDDESAADAQRITTPEGVTYRIVKAGRRTTAGFTRAIGRLCNDRGRSV